jgi:hypothetical protein
MREAESRAPNLYCVCYFEPHWVVPEVDLVDAETDDEAISVARNRRMFMMREVWEHHRLVAVIPPEVM